MTLKAVSLAPTLSSVSIVLVLTAAACGTEEPGTQTVVNVGFDDGPGCAQRTPPVGEPDLALVSPPRFLLTSSASQQSSVGQAVVRPGNPIEAEITVNSATREIAIELTDAWNPDVVIFTDVVDTIGNETVPVEMSSEPTTRGRYYMRLTLCGTDCDAQQIIFDTVPCDDEAREPGDPCGINAPYRRLVIEAGEIVRVDPTCVDLGARPGAGSGTVLIQ